MRQQMRLVHFERCQQHFDVPQRPHLARPSGARRRSVPEVIRIDDHVAARRRFVTRLRREQRHHEPARPQQRGQPARQRGRLTPADVVEHVPGEDAVHRAGILPQLGGEHRAEAVHVTARKRLVEIRIQVFRVELAREVGPEEGDVRADHRAEVHDDRRRPFGHRLEERPERSRRMHGAAVRLPPGWLRAHARRKEPARPVPQAGQRAVVLAVRHGLLLACYAP